MNDRRAMKPGAKVTPGYSQRVMNRTALPRLAWRLLAVAWLAVVLVAVPAGALAAPRSDSYVVYVVQRGDTLANISARMGVSMGALAQANGISNTNLIYVGQVLVAPGESATATTETATETTSTASVYVVRQGDTLGKIAARYGTSVGALMSGNGISNPDRIYPGQRLAVNSAPHSSSESYTEPNPAPTAGRWIDIDLTKQRLTAYEGDTAVFSSLVSTGVAGWRTAAGEFAVRTKVDSQTMSGPGYYLPNVQYVMYFYGAVAIHGTYWHNNFGQPMSHGCVNLPTDAAGWLYEWASIGTPVVTHY
jgi:LysM repeat protein